MVFKPSIIRLLVLAGLIAAVAFSVVAAQDRLWANLALGLLAVVGCAFAVARREPVLMPDPPALPIAAMEPRDALVTLLDQVPLPLLRYSPKLGLEAANRAARTLFRTDDLIVEPPEALLGAIVRADFGAPCLLTLFGRTYAAGISEISGADDTMRLVSLTDIQSEVRVAEATALRDLLRVLSHEIMNSLTPVASLADIARSYLVGEDSPASKSAVEALDVLSQRATGLARFIEAYRTLARLPEPVVRPVDASALVRNIVRVFGQSAVAQGVVIDLDLPSGVMMLDVDEALIAQALLNVLTNAAEATVNNTAERRIRLSLTCARHEVQVLVADNGCGVPDSLSGQIFHAFITTKANGTGTGLNLARQIALAHGGDLILMERDPTWSAIFCFAFRSTSRPAVS